LEEEAKKLSDSENDEEEAIQENSKKLAVRKSLDPSQMHSTRQTRATNKKSRID